MIEDQQSRINRIMAELQQKREELPPLPDLSTSKKKLESDATLWERIKRGAVLSSDFVFNMLILVLYMGIIALSVWKEAFWFIVGLFAVFAAIGALLYGAFLLLALL